MRNIVLCGPKHCGKSTLGRALAARRGVGFTDSDSELEKQLHESCREFYRRCGKEAFQLREAELLRGWAAGRAPSGVIALGGGTMANLQLDNFDFAALGVVVFLDIAPELAFERITRDGLPAFLEGRADPRAEFFRITAARRNGWLRRAQVIVPIRAEESVPDTAAHLEECITEYINK